MYHETARCVIFSLLCLLLHLVSKYSPYPPSVPPSNVVTNNLCPSRNKSDNFHDHTRERVELYFFLVFIFNILHEGENIYPGNKLRYIEQIYTLIIVNPTPAAAVLFI